MGQLLPKFKANLLFRNDASVINDTEKEELAFIMVMQLLRSKQSREYERVLYREQLPEMIKDTKEKFGLSEEKQQELLTRLSNDEAFFKQIAMDVTLDQKRIIEYVEAFANRHFIFYRIQGNAEFISSDNPIMFINRISGNAKAFTNGLLKPNTDVYYPISPKFLLYAAHPDFGFGTLSKKDGCIVDLNAYQELQFISTINKKQVEQCFGQAFARSENVLLEVIK